MSLKLITFDLDDTLWNVAPVMRQAEAKLRDWLALHAPRLGPVPLEQLWAIRRQLLAIEPSLRHRLSTLRQRVLFNALRGAGYSDDQARAIGTEAFAVFLAARHEVELFPEVRPTLEYLASRYQLGVISNGNACVARLGLSEYFQFALSAEQLGIGKPAARPFAVALSKAQVSAQEALHIGDNLQDDVAGALAAGWQAIWFNPQGHVLEAGQPQPSQQISRLDELISLTYGAS